MYRCSFINYLLFISGNVYKFRTGSQADALTWCRHLNEATKRYQPQVCVQVLEFICYAFFKIFDRFNSIIQHEKSIFYMSLILYNKCFQNLAFQLVYYTLFIIFILDSSQFNVVWLIFQAQKWLWLWYFGSPRSLTIAQYLASEVLQAVWQYSLLI